MRIGKIASCVEYWIDEKSKNLSIFGISIVFQNKENSENLWIFKTVKFYKFHKFPNWKIPKIFSLENKPISQILQFWNLASFQSLTNLKFDHLKNYQNSKNVQSGKLSYISEFFKLQIFWILQVGHFWNFLISHFTNFRNCEFFGSSKF